MLAVLNVVLGAATVTTTLFLIRPLGLLGVALGARSRWSYMPLQ